MLDESNDWTRDIPPAGEDSPDPVEAWFRPIGDHFASPEPLKWMLQDWIEAGAFAAMIGLPGSGKTYSALALAASVSTGEALHGLRVQSGPVWYIAGEGKSALIRRALAWDIRHGFRLRKDSQLYISSGAIQINDPGSLAELQAALRQAQEKPLLLVLDTLNRCMSGDENSTADMTAFVQAIDGIRQEFGCAVLVLHHPSKSNPDDLRGSSALRGAVDTVLLVQQNGNSLTIRNTKNRSGDIAQPISFTFRKTTLPREWWPEGFTGQDFGVAVLEPSDSMPAQSTPKGLGQNQRTALLVLQRLVAEHRKNVATGGRDPDTARVALRDWREACTEADVKGRSFSRAKDSLVEHGLVIEAGFFVLLAEDEGNE